MTYVKMLQICEMTAMKSNQYGDDLTVGKRSFTVSDLVSISGNTGETDHPKPEQTDHLKGWRKLPNFAGEDFQFCADFML